MSNNHKTGKQNNSIKILKYIANNYLLAIVRILLIFTVSCFLLQISTRLHFLFFPILLFLGLSYFFYILGTNSLDRYRASTITIITAIIMLVAFVNFMFRGVAIPIGVNLIMTGVGIFLYLLKCEKEKLQLPEITYSVKKEGDISLGIRVDNGKPLIIPYIDRFLHLLLLGPTGSGKSALFYLPMIKQDIEAKHMGVIVLEPKGDLVKEVYALAKINNIPDVMLFDPSSPHCPYFNPLYGDEDNVVSTVTTVFGSFSADSSTYFQGVTDELLRRSLKVVKRLYGNDATLKHLDILFNNIGGEGFAMIERLELKNQRINDQREISDNNSIIAWFRNDYFSGMGGGKGSKVYDNTSSIRTLVAKLLSNNKLNKILCPPKTSSMDKNSYIDFSRSLITGQTLLMTTSQGEFGDLSKTLGMFLMLNFQSAVFNRPGTPGTRKGFAMYIDEFQEFANAGFERMLTQGRSYRVAVLIATQNKDLVTYSTSAEGKRFQTTVLSNTGTQIILPRGNPEDATYFSKSFGTHKVKVRRETVSKDRHMSIFGWRSEKVSYGEDERDEPFFSPSNIIYQVDVDPTMPIQSSAIVSPTIIGRKCKPKMISMKFIDENLKARIDEIVLNELTFNSIQDEQIQERYEGTLMLSGLDEDYVIDMDKGNNFETIVPVKKEEQVHDFLNIPISDSIEDIIEDDD